ncbi:MAG: hypothetical protein IPG85_09560 [Bacteroidetes bacterium]|nr:hypothetical protein [Bacteroidota bacterium]
MNVRNEKERQRISLNLNSRLIGGLRNADGREDFLMMLYVSDAENLVSEGIEVVSKGEDFKDAKIYLKLKHISLMRMFYYQTNQDLSNFGLIAVKLTIKKYFITV